MGPNLPNTSSSPDRIVHLCYHWHPVTPNEVLDHSPSNSVGVTGIIFNLLEEAVTRRFGAGAWAEMLAKVDVGGYLPFDRYPDDDLFRLLAVLPVAADMDAEERLRWFGRAAVPL